MVTRLSFPCQESRLRLIYDCISEYHHYVHGCIDFCSHFAYATKVISVVSDYDPVENPSSLFPHFHILLLTICGTKVNIFENTIFLQNLTAP